METRREWDTPRDHSHAYRNSPQPQPLPLRSRRGKAGARVPGKTSAYLADRPAGKVDGLRRVPKDRKPIHPEAAFTIERPAPNGHIRPLPALRPKRPRARPGRGDGRETCGGTDIEARNGPAAAYHDIGRKARPGRCRRGHAVPGNGPAACAGRRAGVRRCGGEPP